MTTAPAFATGTGIADPAEQVLREAADNLDLLLYAEARQLEIAVAWAELHPGDEVDEAVPYGDRELQVAGDGALTVAEFEIADLALALGLSADAGRNLIGDAVELRHRLPLLWHRVIAGEVRVWKARKIAQATRCLPLEGAAYVDRHLARVAHRCSFAQIDRAVERAKAEYDPEAREADRQRHADDTYLRVRTEDVTTDGKVYIDGLVDLPVALALDKALATCAHGLLQTHPDLTLDQRRALGLGQLAGGDSATGIVLYAHTSPESALVDVDNTRSVVTLDELVEWCSLAGAHVAVRPAST